MSAHINVLTVAFVTPSGLISLSDQYLPKPHLLTRRPIKLPMVELGRTPGLAWGLGNNFRPLKSNGTTYANYCPRGLELNFRARWKIPKLGLSSMAKARVNPKLETIWVAPSLAISASVWMFRTRPYIEKVLSFKNLISSCDKRFWKILEGS